MREKTLKRIITFRTTTDAMAFERYCTENGIPGRLIPVPGDISAGCGMCWMVPVEMAEDTDMLTGKDILRFQSIYLMTL